MHRFSEQQARIGALLGNGANFLSEKTALTKSQWLMLSIFALGAIVVGYTSTHIQRPRQAEPQVAETQVGGAKPVEATTTDVSSPADPKRSGAASMDAMTPDSAASHRVPLAETDPVPAAPSKTVANDAPATSRAAVASAPAMATATPTSSPASAVPATGAPSALDAMVLARIDGLAKDMARISQKLDDVVSKQKQTTTRLNGLIADAKQTQTRVSRNDAETDDGKAGTTARKASPPAARKPAQAVTLTVHRKAAARRRTVEREEIATAIAIEHAERAERLRRLHRRRVALSRQTIFGTPLHVGRW